MVEHLDKLCNANMTAHKIFSSKNVGCEARPKIWVATPILVTLEVRTEYLEATLGLVKCLEISKELIRECVTLPGGSCCMPLLRNNFMDSCSYVRKNTLLAAKGECIWTPLISPKSTTEVPV